MLFSFWFSGHCGICGNDNIAYALTILGSLSECDLIVDPDLPLI